MQSLVACNLRLEFDVAEKLNVHREHLSTQLGFPAWNSAARLALATVWAHLGRFEEAIAAAEGEAIDRASDNQRTLCIATHQLARIYLIASRWDAAAAAFCRSIRAAWQHHLTQFLTRAMLHLPNALAVGRDPHTAARLHGFGTAYYTRHYGRPNRIEARELCRTRRLLRLRLGASNFEAHLAEGAALTTAQAVALALTQSPEPT